jgi:hypothetical protein
MAALMFKHGTSRFPDFDEFRALGGILQGKVP